MAALRIDRPDRLLLRAERVEERDERAALQVRHHIEIGKLADAVARERGFGDRGAAVAAPAAGGCSA